MGKNDRILSHHIQEIKRAKSRHYIGNKKNIIEGKLKFSKIEGINTI
jgi:hypothetical protein